VDVARTGPVGAAVDLHPGLGHVQWLEADVGVDAVGIARGQDEAQHSGRGEFVDDRGDQPVADALPATGRVDEDVGDPAERRAVGHRAGDRDLAPVPVDADGSRAGDGAFDRRAVAVSGPVRLTQPLDDPIEVELVRVVAERQAIRTGEAHQL
jgi:hypothetical protein